MSEAHIDVVPLWEKTDKAPEITREFAFSSEVTMETKIRGRHKRPKKVTPVRRLLASLRSK